MIKKTIQYTNIDGKRVAKDVYFHLFPQDLETMLEDGIYEKLMDVQNLAKDIQAKNENHDVITDEETRDFTSKCTFLFRYFVEKSYGRRIEDEDGEPDFEKNPDRTKRFMNSSVYGAMFMEFVSDPEAGFNFINSLIPSDVISTLQKNVENKVNVQPQPVIQNTAYPNQGVVSGIPNQGIQIQYR